jgi:hypothetical protein
MLHVKKKQSYPSYPSSFSSSIKAQEITKISSEYGGGIYQVL